MAAELSIGRLAAEAGVGVETIRYYQRRGLLETPPKSSGGQRRYPPAFRQHIRFIRRAQALGFTLDDIGSLLRLDHAHACAETHDMALRKLRLIDDKLRDLSTMRDALRQLVGECETTATQSQCPIIRTLADDSQSGAGDKQGRMKPKR
ncbi:MAG: MerR family transcriptional regulator [Burkholderiales bacterium]